MIRTNLIKKFVCQLVIFSIVFTQTLSVPIAYGAFDTVDPASPDNNQDTLYDLIVLVVDSDLANQNNYLGLKLHSEYGSDFSDALGNELTIDGRIDRYAEDLVNSNELTDTKILFYDKESDDIISLISALENLYYNGDGTNNNQLTGVVLLGDIPLPVVNKNGNSFVSMFPYVDFQEKAYNFNPDKQAFELNGSVGFPKPEIWHGVMWADPSDANSVNNLATYLDKNHLYYEGNASFAEFDRKVFFADLVNEEAQMNKDVYGRYLEYLDASEDMAYMRYNKFWANEVVNRSMEDIPSFGENANSEGQDFIDSVTSGDALAFLPDIYAKQIIEQSLVPYYKIFGKYISSANDFSSNTGRYEPSMDMHTVPMFIAMKDEYTKYYLRSVNDALEKKVNEIVERIEQPLPINDYTAISGSIGGDPFQRVTGYDTVGEGVSDELIDAFVSGGGLTPLDGFNYRFHYLKESGDQKLYVNGIDATVMSNAQQCGMWLGSSKTEYFDDTLNFNPKAEDVTNGVYSILTRSMRSDNQMTALPKITSGVNTRVLSPYSTGGSPSELYTATSGAYPGSVETGITGAIIEDSESGVAAFSFNPISGGTDYDNPFEDKLQKGDVITAVNGEEIMFSNSFDDAVKGMFSDAEKLFQAIVDQDVSGLSSFPHAVVGLEPMVVLTTGAEIAASDALEVQAYNKKDHLGVIFEIEFYRGGVKMNEKFSFTVTADDDTAEIRYPTNEKPVRAVQSPELIVVMADLNLPEDPGDVELVPELGGIFNSGTDGALFSLYNNNYNGFDGDAFDSSAGCNAASAQQNSDRCFGMVATLPVMDPGGSLAPVAMDVPGTGTVLKFPEKVKMQQGDEGPSNSSRSEDHEMHVDSYQIPNGIGNYYDLEDIDEIIMNSCYGGYPAMKFAFDDDTNLFGFTLDPASEGGNNATGLTLTYDDDFYGRVLQGLGTYVGSNSRDQVDHVPLDEGDNGFEALVDGYDPKSFIWDDLDEYSAADIVLNDADPYITLSYFTTRYGAFNGIDDDGDGSVDYTWVDDDGDGVKETRVLDEDEILADVIPSWDTDQIARKMFSQESTYVIPGDQNGLEGIDGDVVLTVTPHSYNGKTISSMIIHDEPSEYTILEQLKSQTAFSMPIDDPRYVAFQSPSPKIEEAPDDIDPAANTSEYSAVGLIEEVHYLNLFDETVASYLPSLKSLLATDIALVNGSYLAINGADEDDYDLAGITDEIYDELLEVLVNDLDDPLDGFELENADTDKIKDALKWKDMNIDEKHDYVLTYYLNDSAETNAFVGDQTVFPAPPGFSLEYGYEAAYLVLDGDRDSFSMKFNKDLPDEEDGLFNPLQQLIESNGDAEDSGEDDDGGEDSRGGTSDQDYEFVWLAQFIKELQEFIEGFSSMPNFEEACGFLDDDDEEEGGGGSDSSVLLSINAVSEKTVIPANGADRFTVTITGYDQDGQKVKSHYNQELITLEISQDGSLPVILLEDLDTKNLVNGDATFNLRSGGSTGLASITATSTNTELSSQTIQIVSTASDVKVYGATYFEIEGADALPDYTEEELAEMSGGDDDSDGDGDGEGDGFSGAEVEDDSGNSTDDGDDSDDQSGFDEGDLDDLEDVLADVGDDDNGDSDDSGDETGSSGDGSGGNETSGDGDGSGGDTSDGDENDGDDGSGDEEEETSGPDLTILDSTDIEETELHSSEVEEGLEREEEETEDDGSGEEDISGEDDGEGEEIDTEGLEWEEYFVSEDYYKRFLIPLESMRNRYLVEAYSDRMLAYINDVNPFIEADSLASKYIMNDPDTSFVADGESYMRVQAVIFDSNGDLQIETVKDVKFVIEDISTGLPVEDIAKFVRFENGDFVEDSNADTVPSDRGIATTYLKSGTKTGKFKVSALVQTNGSHDTSYPESSNEFLLEAGDPTSLVIESETDVLVANGQSKTTFTFVMKDKFGNLADNAFNKISLFSSGVADILEGSDVNSDLVGTQLTSFAGEASVEILSNEEVGEFKLIALMMDYDLENLFREKGDDWEEIDFSQYVGSSKTLNVLDSVELDIEVKDAVFADTEGVVADGESFARIGINLLHDGEIVEGYNSDIEFQIITSNLGSFDDQAAIPDKLVNGKLNAANLKFIADTVSGDAEILVNLPGFVSDSVTFDLTHGPATKIEINSDQEQIYTNHQNEAILKAKVLDQFGNLVDSDNAREINFRTTEATEGLVDFSPANPTTNEGIAVSTVSGLDISGVANITASSDGLETGSISLDLVKYMDYEAVEDMSPRALYVSLLGGAFGDMTAENNLAYTMLNSGQVQAVSSITANPEAKKRVIVIDGYGVVDTLEDSLNLSVVPATSSFAYQKAVLSDRLEDLEVADIFVVPNADSELVLLEDEEDVEREAGELIELPEDENIYVQRLAMTDENIEFREDNGSIFIDRNGINKVKIDQYGRVFISDNSYTLTIPGSEEKFDVNNFSLMVASSGTALALISFKQTFDNGIQVSSSLASAYAPGMYLVLKNGSSKYSTEAAMSGYSSDEPTGVYVVDNEDTISPAQAPGFSSTSLENVRDSFGIGFRGDNKHMLLFSAGNSVGESMNFYSSEVGIVFGDPTIRVEVEDDLVGLTNYSKDIGKPLFNGDTEIQKMIDFDYNGDGVNDLLLVYENGLIRLLENKRSNKRFHDQGYILFVANGIESISKIDVNNDSYDDLIVGTKEACHVGEQCVSLYTNLEGHFVRESLDLSLSDRKVYEIKSEDLNNDGCEDVVMADSSGDLSVFYNEVSGNDCDGISTSYGYRKSFGIEIDPDAVLESAVFVYYDGISVPVDSNGEVEDAIVFSLDTDEVPSATQEQADFAADGASLDAAILGSGSVASADLPPTSYSKEYTLVSILRDARLGISSEKRAHDVNGGNAEIGDIIEYQITLVNSSADSLENLILSDSISQAMGFMEESLECISATCVQDDLSAEDQFVWEETGTSLRSHVIKGFGLAPFETKVIKYQMEVLSMPKISFDIGHDFVDYEDHPTYDGDDLWDITVRPEVNPDKKLNYIYSLGQKANGEVEYGFMRISVDEINVSSELDDTFEALGLPKPTDMMSYQDQMAAWDPDDGSDPPEVPSDMADSLNDTAAKSYEDSDYDGCADSWGQAMTAYEDGAAAIADGIQGVLGALRCSGGGCLPIPWNIAFLAPDGAIPGTAVFAAGTANPPYFAPMLPSTVPSNFRLYLMPTLTMGLGTSICAGPSVGHQSPCFNFAVPLGALGVCDALTGGLTDAISSAKTAVVDTVSGAAAAISNGGASTDDTGGYEAGFGDDTDPISAAANFNIKVPGFPAVLTNWIDKQIDEIMTKLLSMPTFYLILPDMSSMFEVQQDEDNEEGAQDIFGLHDFLTKMSSIPLIRIETKEIVIKIPSISKSEIEKYKIQWQNFKKHMKNEVESKYTGWNCNESEDKQNLCDLITADIDELTNSLQEVMDLLEQIGDLPKDIMEFRFIEAKYATQLICYMDAIMEFTGGWVKRQMKIVESWEKAVQDIIKAFKSWKMILDLALDYQVSCDECKSDRFSKLGLLMQLFVAIPEPPIIPIPKLPDVVVDLSQLRTGVELVWPNVVFKPQPISLPNIPTIILPEILPNLKITIPGFYVPDLPTLTLPELPDLPPLPIPELPDLPRPPMIPALPDIVVTLLANLKPIFKILCLIKKGLIPVQESQVSTEIATLTQPSVQALLPILINLGIQLPGIEYDYVKEVRITAKLNFEIDVSYVYELAKKGADIWNDGVIQMVDGINQLLDIPLEQMINNAIQDAVDELEKQIEDAVGDTVDDVTEGVERETGVEVDISQVPSIDPAVWDDPAMKDIKNNIDAINESLHAYIDQLEVEDYPDTFYLTAGETEIGSEHPLLNRSLAEVERDIALRDLPDTPATRQLAETRDALIAYTKGLNDNNTVLSEIDDLESFGKLLVDGEKDLRKVVSNSIASNKSSYDVPTTNDENVFEMSLLGDSTEKLILDTANQSLDGFKKRNLIASNNDYDPHDTISGDNAAAAATPVGFYIITPDGQNENVLNYVDELGGQTHMLFDDMDNDGDHDIIYSMGGDVFLKENFEFDPDPENEGDVLTGPFHDNDVEDYALDNPYTVQNAASPYQSHNSVDIRWSASPEAVRYEIYLLESLYDDIDDSIYTYIALAEPPEESEDEEEEVDPFVIELTDPSNPNLSIELENGNYYVRIVSVNEDDQKSLPSPTVPVSPQSCADTEAPFPVIQSTELEVSIFKELVIDASKSFDGDGEIVEYWLEADDYESSDTDPNTGDPLRTTEAFSNKTFWSDVDSQNDNAQCAFKFDGVKNNDRTNPVFRIGPFNEEGDIGAHKFTLHVVDQSCNSSSQEVTVNVFSPDISLESSFANTSVATGITTPETGELPFTMMRNRYVYRVVGGELKLIPRIEEVRESETDVGGAYEINDFDLEDIIWVENADGEIIAEIHPETGNIGDVEDGYYTVVNEATVPNEPTSIDILNEFGEVMGTVIVVVNANTDVGLHDEYGFDAESVVDLYGVHLDDLSLDNQFELQSIPANDSAHPGGAKLIYLEEDKVVAVFETTGNILLLDERLTIDQKKNDHYVDPLILVVSFDDTPIIEVYLSTFNTDGQIVGPNDVPFANPRSPTAGTLYGTGSGNTAFSDLEDFEDMIGIIDYLHEKGVIDGTLVDGSLELDPYRLINRSEFIVVLLRMLCIVPREEAYQAFADGEGYSDININSEDIEVFAHIKEATLLGLIEGYKGEPDPITGLFPFKPDEPVTRAEASKIIIEALEMKGTLDLSNFVESVPWYESTIEAARDLSPFMVKEFIQNNFIVSDSEATEPNRQLNIIELIVMVERVLAIDNCHDIDADNDGMSDFCEETYGIDDPLEDLDLDGLINSDECYYGLDPTDKDTDQGGELDGAEVAIGTNALNPADDPIDSDGDGLTNAAEIMVHFTDPFNPDTDGGGVYDGEEVSNLTEPMSTPDDDGGVGEYDNGDDGIYLVPSECDTCPCISTFLHKADVVEGDIFFPVILIKYLEYYAENPKEKVHIFSKGNEVQVENVKK